MWYFASACIGAFLGMFFTALFQANRNVEDRERAEHAIKIAQYYKDKCKELKIKCDEKSL